MWFFNKHNHSLSECLNNIVDHHSHILPGVDDGIKTISDSLEVLSLLENVGVKNLWLTPHIMEDIPNTSEHIRERFSELKSTYKGNIQLQLSAEYMIDNLFNERLNNNDLLPIGTNKDHILVETSYFNPPMDLYATLEKIKSSGYHPLLAHPERYVYMEKDKYKQLKSMGVKFQLNIFSLIGLYGKTAQKKSSYLLKSGLYDAMGSDLHTVKQCSFLSKKMLSSKDKTQLINLNNHQI